MSYTALELAMPNVNRAKILAFDGVDGCGKTTLVNQLKDTLVDKGYNVITTSQFEGGMVELKTLVDKLYGTIHPTTVLSLYIDSTIESLLSIEKRIREGEKVDFIIFDRLFICNVVYGFNLYNKLRIKNKFTSGIRTINHLSEFIVLIRKMYLERCIKNPPTNELSRFRLENVKYFYIDTDVDKLVGRANLRHEMGESDNIVSTDVSKITKTVELYREFYNMSGTYGYDVSMLRDFCDVTDSDRMREILTIIGVE